LKAHITMENQSIYRLSSRKIFLFLHITLYILFIACSSKNTNHNYQVDVYQTSEAGDNLKLISSNSDWQQEVETDKVTLRINPHQKFQEYVGFGASFTESSAWNLATIPEELRKKVLIRLFSPTKGYVCQTG